jgi:hypothetical protein
MKLNGASRSMRVGRRAYRSQVQRQRTVLGLLFPHLSPIRLRVAINIFKIISGHLGTGRERVQLDARSE